MLCKSGVRGGADGQGADTDAIFSLGGRQGMLSISSSDSLRSSLLSRLPLTFRVEEVNWSGTGRMLGRRAPARSHAGSEVTAGQRGSPAAGHSGARTATSELRGC